MVEEQLGVEKHAANTITVQDKGWAWVVCFACFVIHVILTVYTTQLALFLSSSWNTSAKVKVTRLL